MKSIRTSFSGLNDPLQVAMEIIMLSKNLRLPYEVLSQVIDMYSHQIRMCYDCRMLFFDNFILSNSHLLRSFNR